MLKDQKFAEAHNTTVTTAGTEGFYVPPTRITPEIILDFDERTIELKGVSSPENSLDFYNPIVKQLRDRQAELEGFAQIKMALVYFNTSSSKCLINLFKTVQSLTTNLKVQWFYEEYDEDMVETGEDFSELLDIPFEYHEMTDLL
ncbi:MAG: DUF1987 domain-containing protein [Cyclobacteriaceae bacterium]|nr:DUF1987 domain-containing protein [Cyclobacteriaceae bacterium HetDA_MAG_MS6]